MADGLLSRAERIRVAVAASLDPQTQARRGQFFTPDRAASLIAAMPTLPDKPVVRVLDPGAGSGMLMSALIERFAQECPGTEVRVTAIEVDPDVIPALTTTGRLCEEWGREHGIAVTVEVICEDLIQSSTGLGACSRAEFDLVIMNPPYAKLGVSSPERRAMSSLGVDCPNLYAAFLALGAQALRAGGQLVAITPRSFANGPYFGRFRSYLLSALTIDRIHTFESRSSVFADTGVLQENVVLSATKGGQRGPVTITVSRDHRDIAIKHVMCYENFILPNDPHRFLRITTNDADTAVAERMLSMPSTLVDLGLQVSTGRVVDFRSRGKLRDMPDTADAPLIYPGNLRAGRIEWPRDIRKPQGFATAADADRKMLMPAGCYVLVKRFSAKEERRRIVAALWDPELNGTHRVAFENHLNVFHCRGGGLDRALAWGLCLWLNGSPVDQFFRTFSGHTPGSFTVVRGLVIVGCRGGDRSGWWSWAWCSPRCARVGAGSTVRPGFLGGGDGERGVSRGAGLGAGPRRRRGRQPRPIRVEPSRFFVGRG